MRMSPRSSCRSTISCVSLTLQHVWDTISITKTAVSPQVRVEPQLRTDLVGVLRSGETLSDFLEATVRQAVDYRRMKAEFDARADAAWSRFQQTGAGVPAEKLIAEMCLRLEARRQKLLGKPKVKRRLTDI